MVHTGHYSRRRRREFLDFMNGIVSLYPDTELHVVLDSLSTHKPKHDRWLVRHPNAHLHYTPTQGLLAEPGGMLAQHPLAAQALRGLSTTSPAGRCAGP